MSKLVFVLTAEHAGNEVPQVYKPLFEESWAELNTHRGFDFGTAALFDVFEQSLAPVFACKHTQTRLLMDYNRSLHHPKVFHFGLNKTQRQALTTAYQEYRAAISRAIRSQIEQGNRVLHLALHSFTPVLNGEERNCDVSLLYDPKREDEVQFCDNVLKELKSSWKVRKNYPYKGVADGLTTALRKEFPTFYAGVELEINQKWVTNGRFSKALIADVERSLLVGLKN